MLSVHEKTQTLLQLVYLIFTNNTHTHIWNRNVLLLLPLSQSLSQTIIVLCGLTNGPHLHCGATFSCHWWAFECERRMGHHEWFWVQQRAHLRRGQEVSKTEALKCLNNNFKSSGRGIWICVKDRHSQILWAHVCWQHPKVQFRMREQHTETFTSQFTLNKTVEIWFTQLLIHQDVIACDGQKIVRCTIRRTQSIKPLF